MADEIGPQRWTALIQLREDAGLTQTALARAAGLSQQYMSEIESGDRIGRAPALYKIAKVLGVTVTQLNATRRDRAEVA